MVIYNTKLVKIITFNFARGITIFPFIFIIEEEKGNKQLLNHEKIHIEQQIETLWFFFWIIYGLSFVVQFIKERNFTLAYRNIIFEKEAFENQDNLNYLNTRKRFNWLKKG